MDEAILTFAGGEGVSEPLERWSRRIEAAWPRRAGPRVETCSFGELERARGGHRAVIVVLSSTTRTLPIVQLIDRLQQAMLPALLLFPDPTAAQRGLEAGGVIVESWDAEPAHLASLLFALTERQHAVAALGTELKTASLVQGGMQGEMERLHEELNLAAVVQKEFIPRKLPEAPGLEMGVLFRPAGYVSGDIYDVSRIGEDHVSFLVADAVGHGVPAALLTMVISKSLRKFEHGAGGVVRVIPPAEALERLNREMCERQGASQRFATAVYGVMHLPTGLVTLAGAGHPPPLHVRREGVVRIETEGPLLGVFDSAEFDQESFVLGAGESLLMYSDGFETAFPAEDADERQLKLPTQTYLEHLARLGDRRSGAQTLADAMRMLEKRLGEQVGSLHQADDVTALVLSRTSGVGRVARAA